MSKCLLMTVPSTHVETLLLLDSIFLRTKTLCTFLSSYLISKAFVRSFVELGHMRKLTATKLCSLKKKTPVGTTNLEIPSAGCQQAPYQGWARPFFSFHLTPSRWQLCPSVLPHKVAFVPESILTSGQREIDAATAAGRRTDHQCPHQTTSPPHTHTKSRAKHSKDCVCM